MTFLTWSRTPAALLLLACMAFGRPAAAAEYSVTPLRLYIDPGATTAAVTINNLGATRIDFQLQALAWSQDEQGDDRLEPSTELVVFPRILTLQPREERVIRVGPRAPAEGLERAYRLVVEEIPTVAKPIEGGAGLGVNLRFVLPVFVKPAAAQARGEIVSAAVRAGRLELGLRNTGTAHFHAEEGLAVDVADAQGQNVFSYSLPQQYLLAGARRSYSIPLSPQACTSGRTLSVQVKAAGSPLRRELRIDPSDCRV